MEGVSFRPSKDAADYTTPKAWFARLSDKFAHSHESFDHFYGHLDHFCLNVKLQL
jgi:hypothetical protein